MVAGGENLFSQGTLNETPNLKSSMKRLRLPKLTRFAAILAGLALATSMSPSLAQTSLSPVWDRYVDLGENAARRGDYDTAIIQYQRAKQAATELTNPLLSQCFVLGAEARIAGAKAAKEFLRRVGRSDANLSQARQVEETAFSAAVDQLFVGEYENSCP
jgi:hypothetical protein